MPVDHCAVEGVQLGEYVEVSVNDSWEVHDLRQTQDTRVIPEGGQVPGVERSPRGGHRRGRDARAGHHEDRKGQAFGRCEHVADAVQPVDVGDLVRISDRRRRAPRYNRARELDREGE